MVYLIKDWYKIYIKLFWLNWMKKKKFISILKIVMKLEIV